MQPRAREASQNVRIHHEDPETQFWALMIMSCQIYCARMFIPNLRRTNDGCWISAMTLTVQVWPPTSDWGLSCKVINFPYHRKYSWNIKNHRASVERKIFKIPNMIMKKHLSWNHASKSHKMIWSADISAIALSFQSYELSHSFMSRICLKGQKSVCKSTWFRGV